MDHLLPVESLPQLVLKTHEMKTQLNQQGRVILIKLIVCIKYLRGMETKEDVDKKET